MSEFEEIAAEEIRNELMKNQTFLEQDNRDLYEHLTKLRQDFEFLKENTVLESDFKEIEEEYEKLHTLNKYLKVKIKNIKNTPVIQENRPEYREYHELTTEIQDVLKKLDSFIEFSQKPNRFLEFTSNFNIVCSVMTNLRVYSRRLDKKRRHIENETLKYDVNRENELLRERIIATQHLITELEVENLKFKLEMDRLEEQRQDVECKLKEIDAKLRKESENDEKIENEVENMRGKLSDCEAEELDLKMQLNHELNVINKAKRDAINAEINVENVKESFAVVKGELRKARKMWEEYRKKH